MCEGEIGEGLGYKVVNAERLVEGSCYHREEGLPTWVDTWTSMLPIQGRIKCHNGGMFK